MKTVAVLLLMAGAAIAGRKEAVAPPSHVYHAPLDVVWTACLRAANEYAVIRFSDKASGTLSFNALVRGNAPYRAGVTVVSVSDSDTTVSINPQKERWFLDMGTSNKLARDFFAAVGARLKP